MNWQLSFARILFREIGTWADKMEHKLSNNKNIKTNNYQTDNAIFEYLIFIAVVLTMTYSILWITGYKIPTEKKIATTQEIIFPENISVEETDRFLIKVLASNSQNLTCPISRGKILFAPNNSDYVSLYDPASNTYYQGPINKRPLYKSYIWREQK
jgi:hypothetical protein